MIIIYQITVGWTALMWATTNGHGQIVKLLLEYSASSSTRSRSGRTIYDLVDTDNEHMVSILSPCTTTLSDMELVIPPVKHQHDQDIQSCEASFRSVHKFSWDQCLPDQMFVFAEDEIDHILNVSISHLKLPMKSRTEIYVPANIIFLCARFAHYYTCRELVHQLISKAVARIDTVVKVTSLCIIIKKGTVTKCNNFFRLARKMFISWHFGLLIYHSCYTI